MNVPATTDASAWLDKYLEGANGDTDVPPSMLGAYTEGLMSTEASLQGNAAFGERAPSVRTRGTGMACVLGTRVGPIERAVPSSAWVSTVPSSCRNRGDGPNRPWCRWSLRPTWRVSTRQVDELVKAMGIDGISTSEVSRMAQELDQVVTELEERPWTRGLIAICDRRSGATSSRKGAGR